MASFSSLNSYAAQDVVMTVEDKLIIDKEGANVLMPLMAWTPIHDIGDPFNGNGVQITHTFHPGNINMSDGTVYTPAEYANIVINKPSIATTGNVTAVNTPVKFSSQSVKITGDYQNQAAVLVNMTTSEYDISDDFCVEYWHYPTKLSSNLSYPFVYTNLYAPQGTPRLAVGYSTSYGGSEVMHRLLVDGDYYDVNINNRDSFLNTWHHFAVVRYNGYIRFFINGSLITFGNTVTPPQSISAIANTTDYSNIADYIRIGSKDKNTNWGYPDGSLIGYLDNVRFSNVARYTTTASITVPSAGFTQDTNTVFLIKAENNAVVDKANTYALNRVLEIPSIVLRGGRPNVTLSNPATNQYQIKYIHDPEDYLAADTYLDFARDYSGVGNPDELGVLEWTTNIKNLDVATYDYTYNVTLKLENTKEVTNLTLGDLPYNYYGNTTAEYKNILTTFNNNTQTTQISDSENPDSDSYAVTITTQHHPTLVVLDTTSTASITKYWSYANGVPGANGQLTIIGTKANVNDALLNLTFTKNDNPVGSSNAERPNARNAVAKLYTVSGITPPGGVSESFSTSTISTQQLSDPPASGISYCVIPNNQDNAIGTSQSLNLIIPNAGGSVSIIQDSSWSSCSWNNHMYGTHEFWIYIDDATKNCNIHVSEICLSLYNGKLWMAWDPKIPGIYYADTVANKPRRIEHNNAVESGTWYHIAMVNEGVNEGNSCKFYVNGVNDSTVYTSANNTVTTANAANGFTPGDNAYWHYGGYIPMFNTAPGWRLPGFAGRLAQIRWSRSVRYTGNFDPPTRLFINDQYTMYLHQFNTTLATDDYVLPQMTSTSSVLTWRVINPANEVIATLTQNYYPVLRAPVFELGDINFQSTDERQSRIGYAGVDINNNPIFVYGFRGDDGNIKVKINKVENATGNVIIGPTVNITTSEVGNPELPVQCIGQFEQGGYDTLDNGNAANVWIGTQFSSNGVSLYKININQEYDAATLTGEAVVINSQSSVADVPIAPGSITEYSLGLAQTGRAFSGSQTGANVMIPMSITTNGSNSKVAYSNVASSVTSGEVSSKAKRGVTILGFSPMAAASNWSAGTYKAPVMEFAINSGTANNPGYEMSLGYQTSTSPVEANNFLNGAGGSNAIGRLQAITLNSKQQTTVYGYNRFLVAMRRRYSAGTSSEYVQFHIQAGHINQNSGPSFPADSVIFGTDQYLNTRPGQTVFDIRLGAWAIVQGSAPSRAWMLYTQDVTTDGNTTFGISTGTTKGLWYRSIDIDSSNNITWGVPVQVTDPALGAIYGRDIVAQSISIGSWTYIYAVMAGPAQSQSTTPYIISLRIPN